MERMSDSDIAGDVIDLVHVLHPEDCYVVPDVVLGWAHDALINAALEDYVLLNGPLSEDADGDLIFESLRRATPRPANVVEAKAILSAFARQ